MRYTARLTPDNHVTSQVVDTVYDDYIEATTHSHTGAERIAACLNACDGIDDPAAALAIVRAALTLARIQLVNRPDYKLWRGDGEAMNALDRALSLLPSPE